MKYSPVHKASFRRDVSRCAKRGCDISELAAVMRKLEAGEPPDTAKNRPHWLVGYSPRAMECHIGGDWLLLYRCSGSDIYYIRTGTHSDLFR